MQGIGHILIDKEKIKILWRTNLKTYVAIKLRKSGQDGMLLTEESEYLRENQESLNKLKAGKVLYL